VQNTYRTVQETQLQLLCTTEDHKKLMCYTADDQTTWDTGYRAVRGPATFRVPIPAHSHEAIPTHFYDNTALPFFP